jgi:hypothetical protein
VASVSVPKLAQCVLDGEQLEHDNRTSGVDEVAGRFGKIDSLFSSIFVGGGDDEVTRTAFPSTLQLRADREVEIIRGADRKFSMERFRGAVSSLRGFRAEW